MPTADQPILRVENIHKSLGGNEVLKGVSLDLPRGSLKVLIGPSGSGKKYFSAMHQLSARTGSGTHLAGRTGGSISAASANCTDTASRWA